MQKTEFIQKTPDNDKILHCTVGLYKLFLSEGREGLDAFQLYMHLQFTAAFQGSGRIRANNRYLMKGTGFGENKLRRLKSWLKNRGLISYYQNHKCGRLQEVYIRVNFLWTSDALKRYVSEILDKEQYDPERNGQLSLVDNPGDNPDLSGGMKTILPVKEN